jgi:hypothetical protein
MKPPLRTLLSLGAASLAASLPGSLFAQETTTSAQLWSEFMATPYTHSHIPNVSFAGYQRGDVPIPEVPVVANVLDFGAVGDGETYNDAAFLRAISAAEQAGGGAVLIPNGHYRLRNTLILHRNGVVLRGESRDGAIINFTRPLLETLGSTGYGTQHWNWMGGLIWVTPREAGFVLSNSDDARWRWFRTSSDVWRDTPGDYENWRPGEVLTAVPGEYPAGVRTITVADASQLKAGDFVLMTWEDPKEGDLTNALFLEMTGHPSFEGRNFGPWLNAMAFYPWPVEIASVNGNEVTLMQPTRLTIQEHYNVQFHAIREHVREVGLEDFTILMDNNRATYSYNNGVGWNGVAFNRAYNSWARNIRVINAETALNVSSSKNLTISGLQIESEVQSKYLTTARNMTHDVLFENFSFSGTGQVTNGINTELFSSGNVWTRGHMGFGTFDSHRMMAFDYVRTDIWMTNPRNSRPGGAQQAGPFTGRRGVHWNIEVDHDLLPEELRHDPGAEGMWVFDPLQYIMGAQIGIRGVSAFARTSMWAMPEGDKGMRIGDAGVIPVPANLYDAQLAHRNATEPSIFPVIRSTWFIPASDVTIPVAANPPAGTSVAEVRAYLDGQLIASSNEAPYTLAWADPVPGRYLLELELVDSAGGSTWSVARTVVIGEREILDHDGPIDYRPTWTLVEHPFFRQGKAFVREVGNSTARFEFHGTRVRVWSENTRLRQGFEVFLNGQSVGEFTNSTTSQRINQLHVIWDSEDLPDGLHTVELRTLSSGPNSALLIDYIEVDSTAGGPGERRAPQAVAGLTAEVLSGSEIALQWHRVSPYESGHRIERSADAGATWTAIATVPQGQHDFVDQAVAPGGTYLYRVVPFNSFGEPSGHATAEITAPTDQGQLAAPQDFVLETYSSDQALLSWTYAGSGHTRFEVDRRMGNQPWGFHTQVPPATRSFRDVGLNAGVTYSYRIRAINDADVSPFTPALSVEIPTGLPILPTSLPVTWFMQSDDGSGSITENTPTRVTFTGESASVRRGVVAALDTPISLAEAGDFVELLFRTEGMPAPTNGNLVLRFGLFNDNGQPVEADFSTVTDASLGFFGGLSTGSREHALAVQGAGAAQILGRGRDTAADLNFGGMTRLDTFVGLNGGQRDVILRLQRQADGSVSMQMQSRDTNIRTLVMQATVPAASVPTYTFNQVAFALGSVTSDGVTITDLTINTLLPGEPMAPRIITHPQPTSVGETSSALFSVKAAAFPAPTYQWFKDGAPIAGATQAELRINGARLTDEALYHVLVSNGVEPDAVSDAAQLTVVPLPRIIVQPQPSNLPVLEGSPVELSVVVDSPIPHTYQWLLNGEPIPEATNSTLDLGAVDREDTGVYRVIVTNASGSVASSSVNLDVQYLPEVLEQPDEIAALLGETITLFVEAEANPEIEAYQWLKNGVMLFDGARVEGAQTPELTIADLAAGDQGFYTLQMTNAVGTTTSVPIRVDALASDLAILIDFGITASMDPGGNWNSLGASGTHSDLVEFFSGEPTGVALDMTPTGSTGIQSSGTTQAWGTREVLPDWATADVLNDRLWVTNGRSATLRFRNLDPTKTYILEIASGFAGSGSAGATHGTHQVVGASGPVEGFNAHTDESLGTQVHWTTRGPNDGGSGSPHSAEGWMIWYDIAPDAEGRIEVLLAADAGNLSRVSLNAARLVATPVPVDAPEPPPGTLAAWIAGFPELSAAERQPLANPAGDGLSNLLKFALDLDPTVAAAGAERSVVNLVETESGRVIELRVPEGLNRPELHYILETSEDLETWSPLAEAVGHTTFSAAPGAPVAAVIREGDVVSVTLTGAAPTRGFYRLTITLLE